MLGEDQQTNNPEAVDAGIEALRKELDEARTAFERALDEARTSLVHAQEREKDVAEYTLLGWIVSDDDESVRVQPMYAEEIFNVGPMCVEVLETAGVGRIRIIRQFQDDYVAIPLIFSEEGEKPSYTVVETSIPRTAPDYETHKTYRIAAYKRRRGAEVGAGVFRENMVLRRRHS